MATNKADESEAGFISQPTLLGDDALDLADLLNTVLDKGVVVHGDVTIAVADVDLIRLNLGLLLAAVTGTDRVRPASATASLAGTLGPPGFDKRHGGGGPREGTASERAAKAVNVQANSALNTTGSAGETFDRQLGNEPAASLNSVAQGLPERINADADGVESGLARLVLTLIEVLRKVLEHQAVRRMEGGRLTDEEVERLGLALSRLDSRMQDLKRVFGLSDADLQIDLGPLGRLR
ncbi:MAG: gas vesicle protein GvpJ [Gemmatimonadaceae bacterium]